MLHFILKKYYYIDCRKYLRAVCKVEEPEVHFDIDQYSDVTRISKPSIFISIGEIIDTHKV